MRTGTAAPCDQGTRHVIDVAALTTVQSGRENRLATDPEFRRAVHVLASTDVDPVEFALTRALLMVKPDCLLTGQATRLVDLVERAGFMATAHRVLVVPPAVQRALWRRQLGYSTAERVALTERLFGLGPVVVVLLRRCQEAGTAGTLPASVALSEVKGSTHPERRQPHHLRSTLDAPNRLSNLFHTSDEPADVLLELGILCDGVTLQEMVRRDVSGTWERERTALRATLVALETAMAQETPEREEPVCGGADRCRPGCPVEGMSFAALLEANRADHGGELCVRCVDASLDAACRPASPWARVRHLGGEVRPYDPRMRDLADTEKPVPGRWATRSTEGA